MQIMVQTFATTRGLILQPFNGGQILFINSQSFVLSAFNPSTAVSPSHHSKSSSLKADR